MESLNQRLTPTMQGGEASQTYQRLLQEVFADQVVQDFLKAHPELTDENIRRGRSKLYEYVHEKQLMAAGKETVAPGYVPKLEVLSGQINLAYVPTEQLRQQQEQVKIASRVTPISMPKFIRNAALDGFYLNGEYATPSRNQAWNAAVDFAERYQPGSFMKGLYLTGPFGVGKTYLLGALANELAKKGIETTLVHFPSFAVRMKGSIAKNTTDLERDRIKQVPILMLDDIGADSLSAWVRDEVLGVILEYRMQEELPTFFSSNMSMAQLEEHLAMDTQGNSEPLKAKRIMERVRYLAQEVTVDGDNLRQLLNS